MANLKSPGRQSSFEYFSPFNAVLNSVGAQHEKALKQAFYNTVAVVFVLAGGAAGVAVYFVLDPFLKPLLWAGLCGAFLHPFKSTMTRIFRKWLSSLRSSSTPLVVGAAVVPFQLINNCSDIVGGFIAKRLRLIVILTLLTPFLYGLYVFRPFLEILSFLYQVCSALYIFMDYFSNPFAVWSIIIGYSLALIFWWTPSSSYTMRILSFPVWMAFANYLASIAGVYRVPLFLVVISLIVVGFVTDATGSKDQVDGSSPKEEPNKRSSIIEGLTVAASVLSPINYDSDESYTSNIEDIPKPSPERTSNETPQSTMPTDTTDGRETRLQRIRRQNRPRLSMKKKSKSKSASYPYFVALIWGIMLTRVWMHAWILQLLPIPFAIYLIKLAVVWSGAWAYLLEFSSLWYERLKEWAGQRKDAIMPAPIRGMVKLVMRGDQKVNSLMEKSIDNLMSVFMVISLVIVSITVTVLLAVQVHHESVHLVTVTGNLVNDVMAKNPQLLKWISENAEFKKTLDSAVERGYILGRKWIAAKVGTYLGDGSGNTTQLQQSVLEVTDRFYHAWMGEGNNSSVDKVANGSIGWTKRTVNETAADLSWGNVVSLIAKLDFKVLFSVVKENLGILMSLLESVYMILKGNVTMVINLVTMVLSLVFFSGTYVLNTGLSMIVFVTALFYLLSTSSDDQYKPVEWFGQIIATGTAGFGESLFKAIGDVFGAALKMATFYGLYTWFTHTLFGINIVFIPSALAAVAAVVPFIGTYWAAIPAVLELWLVQDEGVLAIILAICHILPISFVDTAIYSEISGGGHPYLTGLAVAGGIYCVGLEGAIIGPIVLCCLIVACQVYGSMIAESSPTSGEPTIMSAVEGERVAQFRGLADQYKKTPLQKQTPYRE